MASLEFKSSMRRWRMAHNQLRMGVLSSGSAAALQRWDA
jgi:hypothetical protein